MEFLRLKGRFLGANNDNKIVYELLEKRKYFAFIDKGKTISHEVKVIDLKGRWAVLKDLTFDKQQRLANLYVTANKSTAHITHGEEFGGCYGNVEKAIIILEKLLKKCLYDETNRTHPKD